MTKEMISKQIKKYTKKKKRLLRMLLLPIFTMVICIIIYLFTNINWVAYLAKLSYLFLVLAMILSYRFTLKEPLLKIITQDDYKELLKYMSEIPSNISTQEYFDGMLIIKRTLDKIVYYHTDEVKGAFWSNLCFLQSIFLSDNDTTFISSKVLNKSYLKKISSILLDQINDENFKADELSCITAENEIINNKSFISKIEPTKICNTILILIVIAKFAITINVNWYSNIDTYPFWRIMYNTSVDIIAVVVAILAWRKN